MDFNTYQLKASMTNKTLSHAELEDTSRLLELTRLVLGVSDEAGEAAGALKKYLRKDYNEEELRKRLFNELGDVLWYVSQVADHLGFRLSDIAENNVRKLYGRKERGVLQGDGDER